MTSSLAILNGPVLPFCSSIVNRGRRLHPSPATGIHSKVPSTVKVAAKLERGGKLQNSPAWLPCRQMTGQVSLQSELKPEPTLQLAPDWRIRGGRSLHFESEDTYVLLEPGEEEVFVTEAELRVKLAGWLDNWPGESIPADLSNFSTREEAISYLISSVCELDLGANRGAIQWFEVRLDPSS